MAKDETRQKILSRRARFIGAALASTGLASGAIGCESCQPQPCLSEDIPRTGIQTSASATAVGSASTATPTRPPGPKVCLTPVTPPTIWLSNMKLDDAALAKKLASGKLPIDRAVRIELAGNRITAKGLAKLAAALKRPITRLNLSGNPIGDGGAKVIASQAIFKSLSSLSLAGCGLTKQGVEHLFGKNSSLTGPSFLDLSQNKLGDAGIAALAGSEKVKRIGEMYLVKIGITPAALDSLAASPHFGNVFGMRLQENGLKSADLQKLRAGKAFKGTRVDI